MERQQNSFLEELMTQHSCSMVQAAFRKTGCNETSEDLVQDVFLLACLKVNTVMRHEKPVAWLYDTLNKLIMRELAKAHHTDQPLSPVEKCEKYHELELTMECYLPKGLTESEREILLLRIEHRYSFADISEILGIAEPACRKRFSRSLKKCRKLMKQDES